MTAVQFRNPEVRLSEALEATRVAVTGHRVTLRELLGLVDGSRLLLFFWSLGDLPFGGQHGLLDEGRRCNRGRALDQRLRGLYRFDRYRAPEKPRAFPQLVVPEGVGRVNRKGLDFYDRLIDALLAEKIQSHLDSGFHAERNKLATFDGIKDCDPSPGFHGVLRGYQRLGLGWLRFLDQMGWGGCLADDMGLGKTVQALALLQLLKEEGRKGTTLIVTPKSLIFNWTREAKRFTPDLKVVSYTGLKRVNLFDSLGEYDIVLTTYGTVRRDAESALVALGFSHKEAVASVEAVLRGKSRSSDVATVVRAALSLLREGS